MLLRASEFCFPDQMRAKYFPLVIRASPPEGWPRGTVTVGEGKIPYRNFLQMIGTSLEAEFDAQFGEYHHDDPRMFLSMLEEIALNCPLREEEALTIKKEYQTIADKAGDNRPPIFVQGLISPIFRAFESAILSFSAALAVSLYIGSEAQREIVGINLIDQSPEVALRHLTDPFYAGDVLNRLEQEPVRLKALGYESFKDFLNQRSPFSYGRSRFLMRLAGAIPSEKRAVLTSDHGELLLNIGQAKREALFRGEGISLDERMIDLKELVRLSRVETRKLIRKVREEKRGAKA